ncbi:MAG: hypothetical protein COB20_09490 [SAR86 cluster bacterium]|uniref:Nudix hydrolase domain-containing protein n=1 Tax=SAR86 cluster bacterium TaxID=2030880 RepID=A0A2A4X325_9GAMM|nr:MAG: hypothetical protein COB20_09490 [SAR86 cluster bacterium]
MDSKPLFKNMTGNMVKKPDEAEILPRESAYGIHIADGKVLLVRPTWSEKWDLPGGEIENGETPLQGMAREFLEETGYFVDIEGPLFLGKKQEWFYNDLENTFHNSTMHFFWVRAVSKKSEIISTDEVEALVWVSRDLLNEDTCNASLLPFIFLAWKTI